MNFEALRQRVERREQLVDGRILQAGTHYDALKTTWRDSWTPGRIVIAGLAAGFLVGRSRPQHALKKLGGARGTQWIRLLGIVTRVFAAVRTGMAAASADKAADQAEDAAETAADAVADPAQPAGEQTRPPPEPVPRSDRRRPDPGWETQPRAAEAATEISENARR